jgi:hypothetical protein
VPVGAPGRILVLRFPESGPPAYFVVNADGSGEQPFGPRVDYETRQVSPDGSLLAIVGPNSQGAIVGGTIGVDGSGWHLFDNPDPNINLACGIWAPNDRLACEGWNDSDPSLAGIYTVRASDGSDPQRLTTGGDIPCDYSPDGSQLAFVRGKTLMVVASEGGEPEALLENLAESGVPCDWSPDGSSILTTTTGGGKLQMVTTEGQSTPFVGDGLDGQITNALWSPDGARILLTMALEGQRGDVYTISADGSDIQQITDSGLLEEAVSWLPSTSESPEPPASRVNLLEYGCRDGVARCMDMAAGTYETSGTWAFLRGLTVTVPEGWSSYEQDAGEFELHHEGPAHAESDIYFWRDLVPWVDGSPKPELGTTADAMAAYLLSDQRITVVEGPRRSFNVRDLDSVRVVDTTEARSFSVIVSDSAETAPGTFGDCPDEACIGIFSDVPHWGGGTASLGRGNDMGASQALRVYIASIGTEAKPRTLFIVLSTFGVDPLDALEDWEAQVEPVVASVLIPSVVIDN